MARLVRAHEDSFWADFQTGETKGSLYGATVMVLSGSMKLRVGDIAEDHKLFAEVQTYGKGGTIISAYFNYAQPPHGPPRPVSPAMRKRIIVVGSLTGIDIGSSYGSASRTVRVLDLAPSVAAVERYEAQVDYYNARMTERNAERARLGRKGAGGGRHEELQRPVAEPPLGGNGSDRQPLGGESWTANVADGSSTVHHERRLPGRSC